MTLRSVFDTSLRLIGETEGTDVAAELEERAPYIGAALCTEAGALDKAYRAAFGLPEQPEFTTHYIDLDSLFPLADRFAPAAAYYMSAMFVLDDNTFLYEKLFDRWCDALADISAEIPFVKGSTEDVYPD